MKLEIDLVPRTTWYNNLRKVLPKSEWDILRKRSYAEANHECKICGDKDKLNCDEMWEFDDKNGIQRLKGLQAVCENCHHVKHIGFVQVQIGTGVWPESMIVDLKRHFTRVNNTTADEFDRHIKEAFKTWRERSKKEWKIDFGDFKDLVNKNHNLKNYF